jgi:hypothetical protein
LKINVDGLRMGNLIWKGTFLVFNLAAELSGMAGWLYALL